LPGTAPLRAAARFFVDGVASGFDFFVTGSSGFPNGTLATGILGDGGNIGGTFTIGSIACNFGVCSAPVTGSGSFSLFDGVNTLTSTLTWVDIFTFGATGGLNAQATVNLTNLAYSGTNPDYLAWLAATGQHSTLTFQFAVPTTLPTLSSTASNTSYSGSASATAAVVPEPATVSLLGMGLMGVAAAVRRRRAGRK